MRQDDEAYRYLLTLLSLREERPAGRVSLQEVAEQYGVHRSTVMRSLLRYREQGLLDENYGLTEAGRQWMAAEGKKIRRIADFLQQNQLDPDQALRDARRIVAVCSEETAMLLSNMPYRCGNCPRQSREATVQWHSFSGDEMLSRLRELLPRERNSAVVFFRRERGEVVHEMSMASEGFERTAEICLTPGEEHILLRCRTMSQQSIVGRWYEGMASSLSCEYNGGWQPLEIINGKAEIPLRYFWISYRSDGRKLRGIARLRMGCSAGPSAMGMQTVILEFRAAI